VDGQATGAGAVGRAMRRREDLRLLTGGGRFVDDLAPPGCLRLEFARSPHARGRLGPLDTAAALAAPGVVAVFDGRDAAGLGRAAVNPLVPGLRPAPSPILPLGEVEAVGQPVAAVVARTLAEARDAAEILDLPIDPLPPRAPSDDTRAFARSWTSGDPDAAFAAAAHVVSARIAHARVAPAALEPRAALAVPDPDAGTLTVWLSTQTPHRAKADLAAILGLDPARIRVVAPDVGGAFGGKASLYPEDAVVALAALRLGRPVAWTASRSDDFLAAAHGRGGVLEGELAVDAEGRFLALRARISMPLGHWTTFSATVPARNAARILPGPYAVPAVDIRMEGRLSDTAAVGIYRGAGRPEAAMLIERLADAAARAAGLDRAEIRRRNLIPPEALPRPTPTGETLDATDLPALLDAACRRFGWDEALAARDAARARAGLHGVGLALYVEPCGQGWESAEVRLEADGTIVAATGSTAQGQGRETAAAQIVADAVGVDPERVRVVHGDTAATPPGIGALASRSTPIGGTALARAGAAFREKAAALAAGLLQADPAEVRIGPDGATAGPAGLSWAEIAAAAGPDGLAASERYEAPGEAWGAGAVAAAVSVDPETGVPTVERIVWAEDCGTAVNPMLVEGQLVGGLAQGIGEALHERIVIDEAGQLLTGSFMDYAVPRAADVPPVEIVSVPVRSAMNGLGAKGVGEAGCIGVPAAVASAVLDALRPAGVEGLDTPFTAARIWEALEAAGEEGTRT